MRATERFDAGRRRLVLSSAAAVGGLALAGCSVTKSATRTSGPGIVAAATPSGNAVVAPGAAPTAEAVAAPISLTSSLGRATSGVPYAHPVRVAMWGGSGSARLTSVVLTGGHGGVPTGTFDAAHRHWTVRSLSPAARYKLTAVAQDGARSITFSRSFRTSMPARTLNAAITPTGLGTVGVGIPITVTFDQPVSNRAAVERALVVTSSVPTVGAWHWFADDTATYRPKSFWPANSRVTVRAHLAGVDAGDGVWGVADADPVTFAIGNSVINKVDLASDVLTVVINGKVARTIPVTGGQAGMHTRSGVSIISQKYQNIQMDSESVGYVKGSANYYNLMVHWAMRITDSGEFLHAAPWSVYAQGRENVSHGCVGMSTANALWLYDNTNIGDVAEVTGTDRPLEAGNGWTDFNMSWADWRAGSALHAPSKT